MTLAFFQPSGTSPHHHDPSKTTEGGLAIKTASSLSTHGCNSSRSVDLHPVCLDVPYPDPPLSGESLPCARLSLWAQGPGIPEDWSDKKTTSTWAFLMSEFSQDLLAHPYGLLPPLFHFLIVGMDLSWAWRRLSLNINPALMDLFPLQGCNPGDSSKQRPEVAEVYSAHIQSCGPAFCSALSSTDPKLDHLMVTAHLSGSTILSRAQKLGHVRLLPVDLRGPHLPLLLDQVSSRHIPQHHPILVRIRRQTNRLPASS